MRILIPNDLRFVAGVYERSSTIQKGGSVMRYGGVHLVEWSRGELDRLVAIQKSKVARPEGKWKVCRSCGKSKKVSQFYHGAKGRRSRCAECMRQEQRQRIERRRR